MEQVGWWWFIAQAGGSLCSLLPCLYSLYLWRFVVIILMIITCEMWWQAAQISDKLPGLLLNCCLFLFLKILSAKICILDQCASNYQFHFVPKMQLVLERVLGNWFSMDVIKNSSSSEFLGGSWIFLASQSLTSFSWILNLIVHICSIHCLWFIFPIFVLLCLFLFLWVEIHFKLF